MKATRLVADDGSMLLYDEEAASGLQSDVTTCFERAHWERHGALLDGTAGRGTVLVLDQGADQWVLRHYHRGGYISRFVHDHYVWSGAERTRAFREWRLLAQLHSEGLPVPKPVAARVVRRGALYQADIITAYLAGTRTLSACLDDDSLEQEHWQRVGRMVRRFHERNVDHPDLNAHNILIRDDGQPYLVDFDSARVKAPGKWREAGLARLERSLRKVALEIGRDFDTGTWALLVEAYHDVPAACQPERK